MPLLLWHATLPQGARLEAAIPHDFEAGVYVIAGEGRFGPEGEAARVGQLVIWEADGRNVRAENTSNNAPLELLVLGGVPAEGPLVFHGPFVMNSVEQVRAAEVAYRTGRMGTL